MTQMCLCGCIAQVQVCVLLKWLECGWVVFCVLLWSGLFWESMRPIKWETCGEKNCSKVTKAVALEPGCLRVYASECASDDEKGECVWVGVRVCGWVLERVNLTGTQRSLVWVIWLDSPMTHSTNFCQPKFCTSIVDHWLGFQRKYLFRRNPLSMICKLWFTQLPTIDSTFFTSRRKQSNRSQISF